MTTERETSAIKCPKCSATRQNVQLVYLFEGRHRITFEAQGELVVDSGFNIEPPGGATPGLLCVSCGTRWPLPKGTTVRARDDEKVTTIFGPDGRSR